MKTLLDEDESLTAFDVSDSLDDVEQVEDEFQGSGRWTEHWIAVFKRGDEHVALSYEVPATEYQEGSEGESEVYAVRPVPVQTFIYEKI
jgi:hypothetical protein